MARPRFPKGYSGITEEAIRRAVAAAFPRANWIGVWWQDGYRVQIKGDRGLDRRFRAQVKRGVVELTPEITKRSANPKAKRPKQDPRQLGLRVASRPGEIDRRELLETAIAQQLLLPVRPASRFPGEITFQDIIDAQRRNPRKRKARPKKNPRRSKLPPITFDYGSRARLLADRGAWLPTHQFWDAEGRPTGDYAAPFRGSFYDRHGFEVTPEWLASRRWSLRPLLPRKNPRKRKR